jgi:hypothetical protein
MENDDAGYGYPGYIRKSTKTLRRGLSSVTKVKPLRVKAKRVCANPNCGEGFVPYRPQNIYCSDKCQETVYNTTNNITQRLRDMRAAKRATKS